MTSWFARRLAQHASERADQPAITTSSRTWTWRALDDASRGVADALTATGVTAEMIVVVAMSRGVEVAFAVAGARRIGAVPAIVDPGDVEQAAALCERLRAAAVVVRASDAPAMRGLGTLALDGVAPVGLPRPLRWQPREAVRGVSHLIHTSGTTGDGKCIAWSDARAEADATRRPPVGGRHLRDHGVSGEEPRDLQRVRDVALRAEPQGLEALRQHERVGRHAVRGRPAIIVPLCTSLGFHEMLRALAQGFNLALVDEPFPLALRVLHDLAVTGFQCTPTHVELLLRSAVPLPVALRQINVSSAPIAGDRLRELAARIAPAVVTKSYGLTEVGPVTVLRADELSRGDTVGRPAPGREVTIVNARGRALPPGETGEIVVRVAATPADGYFLPDAPPDAPATTAGSQRFAGGVLRTGDRGHFDRDGFLVLEERAAELLKVGGRTVSAPRIEQQLTALGVFAEVAVVSVPHRRLGEVPAVAFTPSRGALGIAALERLVADRFRPEETPRWFVARPALPRTASGKLRRGAIASALRRWVEAWPGSVTCGARILPAQELPALGGARHARHAPGAPIRMFAADGAPARWPRWAGARPSDPLVRVISVVDESGSRVLAVACLHSDPAVDRVTELWTAPAFRPSSLVDLLRPVLDDAARRLRSA